MHLFGYIGIAILCLSKIFLKGEIIMGNLLEEQKTEKDSEISDADTDLSKKYEGRYENGVFIPYVDENGIVYIPEKHREAWV